MQNINTKLKNIEKKKAKAKQSMLGHKGLLGSNNRLVGTFFFQRTSSLLHFILPTLQSWKMIFCQLNSDIEGHMVGYLSDVISEQLYWPLKHLLPICLFMHFRCLLLLVSTNCVLYASLKVYADMFFYQNVLDFNYWH